MTTIRLLKKQNMPVKIINNGMPTHSYEFRLRAPNAWRGKQNVKRNGWVFDKTSHQDIHSAIAAANEAATWYNSHSPENFT